MVSAVAEALHLGRESPREMPVSRVARRFTGLFGRFEDLVGMWRHALRVLDHEGRLAGGAHIGAGSPVD